MEKINLVQDTGTGKIYLEMLSGGTCVVTELTRFQVGKLLMQGEGIIGNKKQTNFPSPKPGYYIFAQKMETNERAEIKRLLELFDVFHDLDERSIQTIFREIPDDFIRRLVAVYNALGEIDKRERFYRNIPKMKRDIMQEDVKNMDSMEVAELEKVVEKFLDIIYRLHNEGQILLKEKGEVYLD